MHSTSIGVIQSQETTGAPALTRIDVGMLQQFVFYEVTGQVNASAVQRVVFYNLDAYVAAGNLQRHVFYRT